jgi:Uma2 family endonuclease
MPKTTTAMTLEEFLRRRDIDEKPYKEFIDGRVEVKMSPEMQHGKIQARLAAYLDQFAGPRDLGEAFVELRCNFGGRSMLPDVTFLREERITRSEEGRLINDSTLPPDIHVEVRSHEQTLTKQKGKLAHSIAHGCALGWLIDPFKRTIDVYRPGREPLRLPADGVLEGEPVLPGFRLPAAEVFGWLVRRPGGGGPTAHE